MRERIVLLTYSTASQSTWEDGTFKHSFSSLNIFLSFSDGSLTQSKTKMRMNAPSSSFSFLADRKFLARARKVPVRGSAKVIGSRENERERERGGGGGGGGEREQESE